VENWQIAMVGPETGDRELQNAILDPGLRRPSARHYGGPIGRGAAYPAGNITMGRFTPTRS